MGLEILEKPNKWVASHRPIIYKFKYTPDLPPDIVNISAKYYPSSNKAGIQFDFYNTNIKVGDQFFIGNKGALLFQSPVTVSVINMTLGVTNVLFNSPLVGLVSGTDIVDLYTVATIQARSVTFKLYVDNQYKADIRYITNSDNSYYFNLQEYLSRVFNNPTGPVAGFNNENFRVFRIDYLFGSEIQSGFDRYVVRSRKDVNVPACANTEANWQFDITTIQCETAPPKKILTTDVGTTYILTPLNYFKPADIGQYLYFAQENTPSFSGQPKIRTGEGYVVPVNGIPFSAVKITNLDGTNMNVSPQQTYDVYLTVPFVSVVTGNRVAKKKDVNILSATFGQYAESGKYYFYDTNSTACAVTFLSDARSQQFKKNNCSGNQTGSYVTYKVLQGAYTSLISKQDANGKADADILANGQAYANTNGSCSNPIATIDYRNTYSTYPEYGGSNYTETYQDIYIKIRDTDNAPKSVTNLTVNYRISSVYADSTPTSTSDHSILISSGSEILIGNFLVYDQYNGVSYEYTILSGTGYTVG